MSKETIQTIERAPKVLTFATVEDFLSDLAENPPELGIVRVDRRILDSRAGRHGVGLRTGSIMLSAKRRDEILVANVVVGVMQTLNGKPFGREEEVRHQQENTDKALAIMEEEVRKAGFLVGRGVYALPDDLILYQARCQRIAFVGSRLIDRKEGADGSQGDRETGQSGESR